MSSLSPISRVESAPESNPGEAGAALDADADTNADSEPAASHARGDDEARALRALRSLFWAAQEDYRQLEEITGLSPAEVRTLTLVAQHPGQTVSALAARMRLSLPS